jgi:VIT1/CCC1 family predicted Fe2+/Mn2+ transporter
MEESVMRELINVQRRELSESILYRKLAEATRESKNKKILMHIAEDEKGHEGFWKSYTKQEVKPLRFFIFFYYFISRIFGLTFGLKLMENGEKFAQKNYQRIGKYVKEAKWVEKEEQKHEKALIDMLNEERLSYAGSIVLGLNDALVELTGALAGYTLALQNANLIAAVGLVTGLAASMSMAASQYLSKKAENDPNAKKSAVYTGLAYVITVLLLITPFLLLDNVFVSLAITLGIVLIIIFGFTYYISVAKDYNFKARFFEMAALSLTVALISFGIGYLIKIWFGVDA